MKSLEHIIRLVHEGKCSCEKKKSLENTIRTMKKESRRDDIDASLGKVADFDKMATEGMEYMGSGTGGEPKLHTESGKKRKLDEIGALGTNKFQATQFTNKQTVTPVIKPGHNEQAERAANARNIAKAARSPSLHGKIAEGVKEFVRGAEELLHAKPSISLGQLVPYGTTVKKVAKDQVPAVVTTAPKTVPSNVPSAAGKTEVPATLPHIQTKTPTPTTTTTVTKTTIEPETKTATVSSPKIKIPTSTATDTKPVAIPKVSTKTEPKTEVSPAKPPSGKEPPPKGRRIIPIPLPSGRGAVTRGDFLDLLHMYRPPVITHKAKKRMANESVDQDRKKIENIPKTDANRKDVHYVGRKEDDPKSIRSKTARNAELKNKIIDEGKKISTLIKDVHKNANKAAKEYREDGKTRVYPNVVINPDLNRVDLNTYIDSGKTPNDYK